MKFSVVQNDITNMSVDAIVLPANEQLKEGSGTSRVIYEKAGRKQLTEACKEIESCSMGEAVPTLAFNLDANYIIHAVVPKWIDGKHQEYEYLCAAYLSALNVADIMECDSIAFPLLASGNNGFDLELAYDIAQTTFESFKSVHLKQIILVVYGDNAVTYLKEKGVKVINLKHVSKKDAADEKRKRKERKQKEEDKKAAVQFLENQMDKAFEFLKKEENREKIIQTGRFIFQMIAAAMEKK